MSKSIVRWFVGAAIAIGVIAARSGVAAQRAARPRLRQPLKSSPLLFRLPLGLAIVERYTGQLSPGEQFLGQDRAPL